MGNLDHKKHYTLHKNKLSKKPKKIKQRQSLIKKYFLEFGISLCLLVLCIYGLSFFTFSIAKVEGYSMIPTLNHGEWVFVNKLAKVKRFKLVLYKDPISKETSVRRVIGLPKERVYVKDDQLYVNDSEIYERFLAPEIRRAKNSHAKFTNDWIPERSDIPDGKYLILGDNRPYAADSREYGYIDQTSIVGIVELRILPIHLLRQF